MGVGEVSLANRGGLWGAENCRQIHQASLESMQILKRQASSLTVPLNPLSSLAHTLTKMM